MELPTERSKVTNFNPHFIILYGAPKCGKSTLMASLDSNLIIDLEDGYRALSVLKIVCRTAKDIFNVKKLITEYINEHGKQPYKYITIDNATRISEFALPYAAALYRQSPMGKAWGMKKDPQNPNKNYIDPKTGKPVVDPNADIRQLPNGGGWLYLREAIKTMINMFRPLCETLILVAHTKDKQINIDGTELTEVSVDIAGKLADIICGEADAIGLIYRQKNKTFISFKGGDNRIVEARPQHLRGKVFTVIESDENNSLKIDLSQVFLKTLE